MSTPDISVVIPCYNAERWVARAIDSVLAQEGVSVEVIVIDDGSTDRSIDVLRGYGDRISWETGPNRGACAARNRGLALARAAQVMFLDADDYIQGPFLISLRNALTDSCAVCCLGSVMDANENGLQKRRPKPDTSSWRTLIIDWLEGSFVPPCGILWSREYVEAVGGWKTALSKNQDGELILRTAAAQAKFCSSATGNGVYWQHSSPDRISSTLTLEKVKDTISVYADLLQTLEVRNLLDDELERAVSSGLHGVERACVKRGADRAAEMVADFRRAHGWPKFHGTVAHVIACHLLGLHKKEWIAQRVAMTRERLRPKPDPSRI